MRLLILAWLIAGLALLLSATNSRAQGAFSNLDFESTTLPPSGPPGTASVAAALPNWSVSIGGVTQTTVLYNNGTLGNSGMSLLGSGNSLTPVIAGSFSVMLAAGADPSNPQSVAEVRLSQTGLVPSGFERHTPTTTRSMPKKMIGRWGSFSAANQPHADGSSLTSD